jgi:hemolysin activation/secretion protein
VRKDRNIGFMRLLPLVLILGLEGVMLVNTAARAQVPNQQINPGAIESDIERQRRRIEQQQQTPKQQGPAVVGPQRAPSFVGPGGGERFLLRKVIFDRSKFITPEELNAIAAKYVGKRVDIAQLQNLVAEINQIYAQRGIVTAIATLPPQNADKGIVKIKLTEGRLQKTSVQGNDQTRTDYILDRVEHKEGEVLDVPKLNRDVVWFNRTNDTQIRALLQPGTNFGLTDLQFAVTEPPKNTLQLFYDNQGVQTTGEYQFGAYYKRHGFFGIDDRFTFYGVKSEGNINGNAAYNIPINTWGGRLGVSYTQGAIKIIRGAFRSLDVTGTSNQASVNLAQPFIVSDAWLVQATAAYTYGNSETDFASVAVTNDRYTRATGGLSATASGNNYSLTVAPALNRIDWHDRILGGDRSFDTLTGSVNGTYRFPGQFYGVTLGSYQYTWEKLLPGDQIFSIGGPTTVRGYPTNAVAGDSGYYFNFEFHRDMSDFVRGLDVFVFTDSGSVYSTFPAVTQLDSSGFGLSWTPYAPITFEASFASPWHAVIAGQSHYEFYGRVSFRPLLLL